MDRDQPIDLELEIDLLRRTGQGDRASFEQLYDRYSGVLFSTAYRVLNNQQAAEDVLQEVFVTIWEKAPLYDPERGRPLTWAVTLTRNRSIDRLRGLQRRARLHDEVEKEAAVIEQFEGRDALQGLESSEKGVLVRRSLERLSAEQRHVLELAFFGGLTQTEIAEKLGEPLGTVKARIRRGMLRLRDIIAPQL